MKLFMHPMRSYGLLVIASLAMLAVTPAWGSKGSDIRVQGPNSTYKIEPLEGTEGWKLKGPGMNGFSLYPKENGSWVVLDPAKMIRQRTEKTGGRDMKVLDPEGNLRHTVEFSKQGFYVRYPDGKILCRIELVDDKNFRIYDTKDLLIMTGRAKGKTITVKDVGTKQRLFKIKGKLSIEDAAFFSVPLQFTETVVIWKTATR
jgi:hypothetical protein